MFNSLFRHIINKTAKLPIIDPVSGYIPVTDGVSSNEENVSTSRRFHDVKYETGLQTADADTDKLQIKLITQRGNPTVRIIRQSRRDTDSIIRLDKKSYHPNTNINVK